MGHNSSYTNRGRSLLEPFPSMPTLGFERKKPANQWWEMIIYHFLLQRGLMKVIRISKQYYNTVFILTLKTGTFSSCFYQHLHPRAFKEELQWDFPVQAQLLIHFIHLILGPAAAFIKRCIMFNRHLLFILMLFFLHNHK